MIAITSTKQISDCNNSSLENKIFFDKDHCVFDNSCIEFHGKKNILYLENGVNLKNTKIRFLGDYGLVVLRKSRFPLCINLSVYSQTCTYIGQESYFNGLLNIINSEAQNIFIGDHCLFSFGIWIRNSDAHPIFDMSSKSRINPGNSVIIGDHVWIGQGSLILKGCRIGSGSVIGAASCLSHKLIGSNEIWAGNPVKKLKDNIIWQGNCIHDSIKSDINLSEETLKKFCFMKDEKMSLFLDLSKTQSIDDKLCFIHCFDMIK